MESHKQQYKHLKPLLACLLICFAMSLIVQQKAIPPETPTVIELEPQNKIQVTLFDANHCTGAVMFCGCHSEELCRLGANIFAVIENDSKAILYTGDIRSEPWFVNSLVRNPFLIEYASGLKSLDCIYLDTSNIGPTKFPTKADGLKELLQKVAKYPPNSISLCSLDVWLWRSLDGLVSRLEVTSKISPPVRYLLWLTCIDTRW